MQAHLEKLIHRMNRAYGCFIIWKYIRKSISIPENGREEAERRVCIMNKYNGIFTGILYATENCFITDLYKFFDKSKKNLKLETLIKSLSESDKEKIKSLLDTVAGEIERVKNLRHNFSAHEPKNPTQEKIYTSEVENIFNVIEQVLNIISRSYGGDIMTWEKWEDDNNTSLSLMLRDLECGYKTRMGDV